MRLGSRRVHRGGMGCSSHKKKNNTSGAASS